MFQLSSLRSLFSHLRGANRCFWRRLKSATTLFSAVLAEYLILFYAILIKMKRITFIFILAIMAFLFFKGQSDLKPIGEKKKLEKKIKPTKKISPTNKPFSTQEKQSIFLPYWTNWEKEDFSDYDRIIYFGLTVNEQGAIKKESGYKKLKSFANLSKKEKWLTLRLTDTKTNLLILENQSSWEKINQELENIVKEYQFQGIVLDLELSSIADKKTINQINQFVQYLYTGTKGYSNNTEVALTIYGDSYYRQRPYDLKFLSQNSDEIMIMAYDLHKKRGEPGPNFPLKGKKKYGYDMETMINDFSKDVPQEKITVVFGMFGYDWMVDEKKRPIRKGKALTLNEIKKQFLDHCQWKSCLIKRDNLSQETEIDYIKSEVVDNYGYLYPHIIWFEDQQSVASKSKFLKQKGINNFAFWTWGYFN